MPRKEGSTSREQERLSATDEAVRLSQRWGPYVSDRAWGTVREDYSPNGDAWNFLTHDLARSKAYRWGEDGIAGICDRYQLLVFALAFWNGRDPILKERFFGLNAFEGNHGEDVKEYYFHLDNTPTHSYMRMLYKYPQREFPYSQLIEENRRRAAGRPEFELMDTGIFDDDRYFDIFIEYAKAGPEDICVRIEAFNRGPDSAVLHILPHLWFRNTWAWTVPAGSEPLIRPAMLGPHAQAIAIEADSSTATPLGNIQEEYRLGTVRLYGPTGGQLLFTNNETNGPRVFGWGHTSRKPYVKDAFHRRVIHGEECVNPQRVGTKACFHYTLEVSPGHSVVLPMRLSGNEGTPGALLADVDEVVLARKKEADEFFDRICPAVANGEDRMIFRQALAGMLWNKQIYLFDVNLWLDGDDPNRPPPPSRKSIRNAHWRHLNSARVLMMPDKWEYPWFAAWDLAFQCLTLALVDLRTAKHNLWLLLFEQFQHPNGQIPAYEWEFSDLNPPVQAWAAWRIYLLEKKRTGQGDRDFLERCLHKLLINFAWWVNKVDSQGLNVFEGGFLGLDNITVVDRSAKLSDGAIIEQSDASGWMAFFCLHMMRIALELAGSRPAYENLAIKFFEHFISIGAAMKRMGGRGVEYQLWDEEAGFFYDALRYPNGQSHKFRTRSLVGLIPMFAIEFLREDEWGHLKHFPAAVNWFINNRRDMVGSACYTEVRDGVRSHILSILDRSQLRRILERLFDPDEFLSPQGIRSLSKYHEHFPFVFGGSEVRYVAAEADTKIKGGNSNWRGPIWFPTTYLIIESLLKFSEAFGEEFVVRTPADKERALSPRAMAREIARRMIGLFRRNASGKRPVFGEVQKFQNDPHWRDYLLFYEYFNGDTGAGLGASHQTGWTALVANLIDEWSC